MVFPLKYGYVLLELVVAISSEVMRFEPKRTNSIVTLVDLQDMGTDLWHISPWVAMVAKSWCVMSPGMLPRCLEHALEG